MSPRLADSLRLPWRSIAALALLAVAPKCVACLVAYIGLGAALGLGGPELCGVAAAPSHAIVLIVSAVLLTIGITCVAVRKRDHR